VEVKRSSGTTRAVYLIGRWAVKVPVLCNWDLFLRGLLGNMQEAGLSLLKWPELCPVVFACPGGWFIVMRRAEPLSSEQFFALNYAEWIKGGRDLPKGEWLIPVENKPDSFGLLNGRIVAVDYGS
jgi:hypothetical protein